MIYTILKSNRTIFKANSTFLKSKTFSKSELTSSRLDQVPFTKVKLFSWENLVIFLENSYFPFNAARCLKFYKLDFFKEKSFTEVDFNVILDRVAIRL